MTTPLRCHVCPAIERAGHVLDFDRTVPGATPLYLRMADHLEARIMSGDLPPRTRFPPEILLAAQYRVALGTGRKATAELRRRGLVVTTPTRGTFVVEREP